MTWRSMPHYRVRLLSYPVIMYSGISYQSASKIFDSLAVDRVIEQDIDGHWYTIVSVERQSVSPW